MKPKKNNTHRFNHAKKITPTRLGEVITDGLPSLVIWNFLFILSCIPVITIGPAMAAMSFCTNALVIDDRPYKKTAKLYVRAFLISFAKTFPIGLFFLFFSAILGTGFFTYLSMSHENIIYLFMSSFSLLTLILFWGISAHLYPLVYDFEQTDWETLTPVLTQKTLRVLISEAGMFALTRMIPTAIGLIFSILCLGLLLLFIPVTIPLLFTLGFSIVGVAMAFSHTKAEY